MRPLRKTISRTTTQPGFIEAYEDAPIYAKIAGYVAKMHVDIGDRVHGPRYSDDGKMVAPGQLLIELFVPELEDELHQKEAALRQAQAGVEQAQSLVKVAEAMLDTAKADLARDEAGDERARAKHERWKSEYQRVAELARTGVLTQKVADETLSELRAAEAGVLEAAAQLAAARAAVHQAQAQLEKSRADFQAAEAQVAVAAADARRLASLVDYTQVRAPFDGVITQRNTNLGHFVSAGERGAGQAVFTLVHADVVRVFLDVPELDAASVDPGDEAIVVVQALQGKKIFGKVSRMSWALNATARTLRAEVDIPNPSGELRPGMYATVTVVLDRRDNVLTLPNKAIVADGERTFCWQLADGQARQAPLTLGLRTPTESEIVSGLSGNEQVIDSGGANLKQGQAVQVSPPASS
jgi:RND family efflux transporter MFP subunit